MSPAQTPCPSPALDAHAGFLALKPAIEQHARIQFRHLNGVDREEAIAEAVAAGFQSYVGLIQRGKDPAEFPAMLATYAALRVKDGRTVGSLASSRDVISRSAQRRRGFTVESLPLQEVEWGEALIDDRQTPVPDQAAFRIDFPAFRQTLTPRDRKILDALAMGDSGKDVAERFGLSPARVTQLRQQWQREWQAYIGESDDDGSEDHGRGADA